MYRLSIIDGFCPRPYDENSLVSAAMGGTESAIVLLAEALSEHAEVAVVQHCRQHWHRSKRNVIYRGRLDDSWHQEAELSSADVVIVINSPKILALWRRRSPGTRLLLWRHNLLGNRHRRLFHALDQIDADMVCVSRFHAMQCQQRQTPARHSDRVRVIANAVQVNRPANTSRQMNHLLCCSSPHKGLDEIIARFQEIRSSIPSLQLRLCNPGYLPDPIVREPGVQVLGALSRPQLHQEMASSLCIFYPQTRFQETFGLVGAEANALGTPVLAPAGFGALPEVLQGEGQLLAGIDGDEIVKVLHRWRSGNLPKVSLREEFRPTRVAAAWVELIGDGRSRHPARPIRQPAVSTSTA